NVLELTGWLKRKAEEDGMTLFELVQHVALVTMLERSEGEEPDAVKLSTLHAAKGLEYPHVYLAGVEEGLLPHLGKDDEQGDPARAAESLASRIEEERRLMYVGITRAQRSLHLSWCKKRRRAREDVVREPSRFIEEMGLGEDKIQEDEATRAMSPQEPLGMLTALLATSASASIDPAAAAGTPRPALAWSCWECAGLAPARVQAVMPLEGYASSRNSSSQN